MKLSTWRPKWFRWTRTERPPMRAWPPFLVEEALASSARRMAPAQVPQVGFRFCLRCVRTFFFFFFFPFFLFFFF